MKKEQMQKVIDVLRRVEERANAADAFDIGQPCVSNRLGHDCGTVHCVAGWFAVGLAETDSYFKKIIEEKNCDYSDGANAMARMLDCNSDFGLEWWFSDRPEIWGNDNGGCIFSDENAYNGLSYDGNDKPMSIIIEHFENVKGRLPE